MDDHSLRVPRREQHDGTTDANMLKADAKIISS